MTDIACMARSPRSFSDRLWSRLGFGMCHVPAPEDTEGFAPSYIVTGVISQLDWRDRIRALVSGKIMVETHTKTDVIVGKMESVSRISVLPPNYPVKNHW